MIGHVSVAVRQAWTQTSHSEALLLTSESSWPLVAPPSPRVPNKGSRFRSPARAPTFLHRPAFVIGRSCPSCEAESTAAAAAAVLPTPPSVFSRPRRHAEESLLVNPRVITSPVVVPVALSPPPPPPLSLSASPSVVVAGAALAGLRFGSRAAGGGGGQERPKMRSSDRSGSFLSPADTRQTVARQVLGCGALRSDCFGGVTHRGLRRTAGGGTKGPRGYAKPRPQHEQ